MGNNEYEYRGLVARSWDFIRGDTTKFPDRGYYRDIIKNDGEPSLIVGCGTGRLLLEYLADGLDVEGIDVSPEMLEICKRKAARQSLKATVHTMAMESMDLQRSFNSIIVPSSSFQLVPDLVAAKEALKRFFEHLLPGGQLVISIWHILKEGTDEWGDWWQVAEREGFEEGKSIRRWERSRYDSNTQLRHTENRYEIIKNGEVVYSEFYQQSPELRNYSPGQLTEMLDVIGFSNIHTFSGFTNEPATEEDEVFCIFGSRE